MYRKTFLTRYAAAQLPPTEREVNNVKKNIIALFLIAIMAVSVYSAAGLTTATKAQAATATHTTLNVPRKASISQPFTISGTVKTRDGASVGTNGQVALYWALPGHQLTYWKTVPVTSGTFATTAELALWGAWRYQARYLGTHSGSGWEYYPSTSATKSVVVKTQNYLSASALNIRGQNYISGVLYYWAVFHYKEPFPNQKVYIYKRDPTTSYRWVLFKVVQTDNLNGRFYAYDNTRQNTWYYVSFPQDTFDWGVRSGILGPV